uniref:SAND domain-containing protein n=1 Tax=Dicentrarchus labrax TaxID=13489 RepID=A0A8P4G140_DICLA
MERKRIRLRLMFDEEEEEEEEEDRDRRSSLRKRKRARYIEDDDEEEEEEEDSNEGEEEEDNKESSEQPGPSTQCTHNQRMQKNRLLTVTCGNKTGILDVEKLNRGEECIKCQNSWFSPPTFEEFGGKGSCKKWKRSIFYGNKPLQFLFEQGSLTTKGFKKRGTSPSKKIRSSFRISDSSSEESQIQSAEETEEDDVRDEDWIPGSEELVLETEEERVGVENGGEVIDSGADKSEEEEDKKQQGEIDEDVPAVDDNDNGVCEEREPKLIHSTPEKHALEKKVKVVVKRLPEFQVKTACQSIYVERDTLKDDENAQNEEDRQHNCSAIDDPSVSAGTHIDPSEMSDIIVGGSEKENGEEFVQSDERKEDGQTEIKTETGKSPTPLYALATSSPDIKPETENMGATSNHWEEREGTERCGNTPEKKQSREEGPEIQIRWIQGFEDCENANNDHLNMSTSEASGQPSPIQRGIKKENMDAVCGGAPTEFQGVLVAWTPSGYEAAESQVMKLETRVPETNRASDISQSSDMAEAASSRPSTSCDLDTMDLDQLKREKIKLQIKVLKLQEEYYTQKIRERKE